MPLTPCRIVDTREGTGTNGTPFGNLTQRSYYVSGTAGFVAQGGRSGGCGIPYSAVAIAAAITAVLPDNGGYVRAWPFGQAEPQATILSYGDHSSGTGATLSILNVSASAKQLYVRNYSGPTDIVIDVTGYYAKPLHGMISSSGEAYAGSSRILAASRSAVGVYTVQFDRNIHYCSALVTVWDAGYYASSDTYLGGAYDSVQVRLYNAARAAVDRYFYIEVVC